MNRIYHGILFLMIVTTGCATISSETLPPIGMPSSGVYQTGKFVWFDLLSEDVWKAKKFYGELFEWRIEASDKSENYFIVYNGSRAIGGIVAHENRDPRAAESLWIGTLSVDNVDQSTEVVRQNGGIILEGPIDAPNRCRMALVADPAGAPFALLRADGGDPVGVPPQSGDWLWSDLIVADSEMVKAFYNNLIGYEYRSVETGSEHSLNLFLLHRKPQAGVVELKWEGVEANWLPYIKVEDLDATIEKARRLGGKLVLKQGNAAVLVDPDGAAFGIQHPGKEGVS
jgi:predicted enzyme related to lactoylglutathione lyase